SMNRIRFRLIAIAGLALTLVATLTSAGQPTQPSDDAATRGGMAPPPYSAEPYHGYNDYPSTEVQAVPVARAQSARLRAEQDLAQLNMHRWIDRAWDDFEHSKDYVDAAAAEKKAYDDYQRERDRVLRRLSSDSTYRALVDLITDMREKIER